MDTGDELVVLDSKLKLYSYFRSSCSWRESNSVKADDEQDIVISDSFATLLKYIEEKASSAEKLTWVQYHIGK
ncbi:hypothetical protein FRX31_025659 [Thalictrum thalictroides]|uniref:Uncharacterized protein n=1 Tax=Thalictrum thalictroides TaxID=46969 RepID=A0A7J6VI16_THATH|nr:hypothetical protein FRX31_025659 [Thalictrum thalictroides]